MSTLLHANLQNACTCWHVNIPIQGTFQITPTSKITHQQLSAMHPSTPRNIKHWIPKAQNHLKAGQFGCTGYHQTIKLESCLLAAVAWYKSAAYQPSHSSGIFVRQQCLNLAPGNVMGGVAGVPNSWCQSPKLIHLAAQNSQNWNSRVRKRKFQVFVLESSFLNVLCWGFSRIVQRFQTGWGKHPKDTVLHFLPSTRITFQQMCDRKLCATSNPCHIPSKSLPWKACHIAVQGH